LENLKGREHFGNLGADERIILRRISNEGINWIQLARDGSLSRVL
jgi:hypothetical protein